jgi:UDP-glucuronate decarboxylase
VARLKEKYEVITPGSAELDLESGSTLLNELCKNQNVDSVIHLANPRIYTSNVALGKTLSMLRNVLEVCSSLDIPLIYPSSWEVYSGYVGTIRAQESTPLYPRGPYGESKFLAEVMIKHWEETTRFKCAVIRSSALYGEGSTKPRFIYNFISKCENDSEIVTHKYLNDRAGIDLLHVDDFVNALEKVYEQKFLGTLNIGSGTTTSTFDLATKIKDQMKSNSTIREKMIDTNTPIVAMDIRKAADVLGWNPRIDLAVGLGTLIKSQEKRKINE